MWKIIQKIWNDLLNLFYPNSCRVCGNLLVKGQEQICTRCLCALPYTADYLDPEQLAFIFIGKSEIRRAVAFLHYKKETSAQRLIFELKYYDNKELAYYLGRLAFLRLKNMNSSLCEVDVLLPIPLHKRRLKQRGYNQSEWIAKGISSVLALPIDTTSVIRRVNTQTQTRLSTNERKVNMQDVFELRDASSLKNKRVLLIDDVLTTGSTFNACAKVLEDISGISLSVFALARVEHIFFSKI